MPRRHSKGAVYGIKVQCHGHVLLRFSIKPDGSVRWEYTVPVRILAAA